VIEQFNYRSILLQKQEEGLSVKFTRVRIKEQITREINENETLLSFQDDDGNYAFQEWWEEIGSEMFAEWCSNQPEYIWLLKP
jgi:hypothetical protein